MAPKLLLRAREGAGRDLQTSHQGRPQSVRISVGRLFIKDLPQPRRGNDLPHDAVFVLSR